MAIFLARETIFSLIAPELKSLKYGTSLSPLAGDLEEPVLLGLGVHPLDRALDHGSHGGLRR